MKKIYYQKLSNNDLQDAIEVLRHYQTLKKIASLNLINTTQVIAKYCVSRSTVYRLRIAGLLIAIFKYKSYYFEAGQVQTFFNTYWKKQKEQSLQKNKNHPSLPQSFPL